MFTFRDVVKRNGESDRDAETRISKGSHECGQAFREVVQSNGQPRFTTNLDLAFGLLSAAVFVSETVQSAEAPRDQTHLLQFHIGRTCVRSETFGKWQQNA